MRSPRSLLAFLVCAAVASGVLAQSAKSGRVWADESATRSLVEQPPAAAGSSSAGRNLRTAPLALGWQAGVSVSTSDNDCIFFDANGNPYYNVGPITTSWVSYYGDPNAGVPKVGDVYYTRVFVSNPAACQSAGVQPWLILPSNTFLAISSANPVYCWRNGVVVPTTSGCSQSPPLGTSLSGASGYNLGFWADLKGGNIEIRVPVYSGSTGTKTLYARVDTSDGWSNPWATPQVSYIVGSNPPTVSYPAPSSTLITDTTVRNTADVFNHYTAGTLYFDIGTTTSYGTSNGGNAISNSWDSAEFYTDWAGLNPGTLYHWRARFTYGAGSTALGVDQTFTTIGTVAVPAIPTGVNATAATPTTVSVTWYSSVGATSYTIWRRGPGVLTYANIGTSSSTSYTDTIALANTAYLYRVRAVNTAGSSADSLSDLATTVIYSDDRLVEFVTVIKAAHLIQLRTAVDAVRALAGLAPGVYTDTAAAGLKVKAVHITELRAQYDQAIGVITGRNSSWATTVAPGVVITFVDFQQLRDRLK
jgi:hypothetical protein